MKITKYPHSIEWEKDFMKPIFFILALIAMVVFAIWGLNQDRIVRERYYQENYQGYCESRGTVSLGKMESRCLKYFLWEK